MTFTNSLIHCRGSQIFTETLPENDRTRYTITPVARKDLLTRLLKLNHARAAEEAAAQPPSTKGSKPKKPQRVKKEDELL